MKYLSGFEYIVKYLPELEETNELGHMYLFSLSMICDQLIIFELFDEEGSLDCQQFDESIPASKWNFGPFSVFENIDKMIFQCLRLFEIKYFCSVCIFLLEM